MKHSYWTLHNKVPTFFHVFLHADDGVFMLALPVQKHLLAFKEKCILLHKLTHYAIYKQTQQRFYTFWIGICLLDNFRWLYKWQYKCIIMHYIWSSETKLWLKVCTTDHTVTHNYRYWLHSVIIKNMPWLDTKCLHNHCCTNCIYAIQKIWDFIWYH